MAKTKLTDFTLCAGALIVGATVALLSALKVIETHTALVFLGLAIACIAMSQINLENPARAVSRRKKSRK